LTTSYYRRIKKENKYDQIELTNFFSLLNETKIKTMAESLNIYLSKNLSETILKKGGLKDYKTNPYVLITSASSVKWADIRDFAKFLFNSKLYAGLETSFGKQVETQIIPYYPTQDNNWSLPTEKIAEAKQLEGLGLEQKAGIRAESIWREIDASPYINKKRYLVSIKSGPNCINDTQVSDMYKAIETHYNDWYNESIKQYNDLEELNIVIGLTYGTEKTTNNKENQILVKLLNTHFKDTGDENGTIMAKDNHKIRVYRLIGTDFWSFIGNPEDPASNPHIFLEVLIALLYSFKKGRLATLESLVNEKIIELSTAIKEISIPPESLPLWIKREFTSDELLWLISAITSYYD